MKKRLIALLLALSIPLLLLTACQKNDKDAQKGQNQYYVHNDVVTNKDLDDGRMVIVVDTQYNVSTTDIEQVIEAKFPEVNVVLRLQSTPDSAYQTSKLMEHGLLGEIFFCATGVFKDGDLLSKHFIDLSNAPFINNYYQNALDGVAVNAKIYMLPGFSDIFGIIYDRTLFEAHGWKLPQSRDEFIKLCQTIEDTMGYQAFMPTMLFGRMAMLLSHGFHYQDVISGADDLRLDSGLSRGRSELFGAYGAAA